jgi:2,3-bisphosphoglycerate-independent phosphoglycerate mutase
VNPARRCIVLILDGLGDRPVAALGGRTPLEAARTPRLDRMAATGYCGLVDPIAPGRVPNTHTGVGVLFGLRPGQRGLLHRGPVEAAGAGVHLQPGDIAFRANLATLAPGDGGLVVLDRRAGRVTDDAPVFAEALREVALGGGVVARFHATDQHRGALVLSGPGLSAAVTNTDPGDGDMPAPLKACRAKEPAAEATAELLERYLRLAHEILRDHPLNRERVTSGKPPVSGVMTRGAGAYFELDGLLHSHGLPAALVVGCNTVAGLGRVFGLQVIREPGFTADRHTDVVGKLRAARLALESRRLVYVHIKAPDLF